MESFSCAIWMQLNLEKSIEVRLRLCTNVAKKFIRYLLCDLINFAKPSIRAWLLFGRKLNPPEKKSHSITTADRLIFWINFEKKSADLSFQGNREENISQDNIFIKISKQIYDAFPAITFFFLNWTFPVFKQNVKMFTVINFPCNKWIFLTLLFSCLCRDRKVWKILFPSFQSPANNLYISTPDNKTFPFIFIAKYVPSL